MQLRFPLSSPLHPLIMTSTINAFSRCHLPVKRFIRTPAFSGDVFVSRASISVSNRFPLYKTISHRATSRSRCSVRSSSSTNEASTRAQYSHMHRWQHCRSTMCLDAKALCRPNIHWKLQDYCSQSFGFVRIIKPVLSGVQTNFTFSDLLQELPGFLMDRKCKICARTPVEIKCSHLTMYRVDLHG